MGGPALSLPKGRVMISTGRMPVILMGGTPMLRGLTDPGGTEAPVGAIVRNKPNWP